MFVKHLNAVKEKVILNSVLYLQYRGYRLLLRLESVLKMTQKYVKHKEEA